MLNRCLMYCRCGHATLRRATALARDRVKDMKLFKCVLSAVCCVFNRGRTGDIKRDRVRA